jgi:DNA modification methylase
MLENKTEIPQLLETAVIASCGSLKITCEDNIELLSRTENESIDIICIDPPYLYLKNQKLEREFDEIKFFKECKRVLTKDGFVIMFGRGISFYRWNCVLSDLGFIFKEEIVWNKSQGTSPVTPITRVHETIAVFGLGKAVIKNARVPYLEHKIHNISSLIGDVKRIKSALGNPIEFDDMIKFLETGNVRIDENTRTLGKNTTVQTKMKQQSRGVKTLQAIKGMKEKSIIIEIREHYTSIHPTQKPVRLLERLINICLPDKPKTQITVADFFGGSMSTMEAVYNLGLNGISCEIDNEYFEKGIQRINNHVAQQKLF